MIDFTTVQTFPVAESIASLQSSNTILGRKNQLIGNILAILVIGGTLIIINEILKNKNEDEQGPTIQPKRN